MWTMEGTGTVNWVLAIMMILIAMAATAAFSAEEHPVCAQVDPEDADSYVQAVDRVMAMSEEEMLDFMPELPAICYCGCPNCYEGGRGRGTFEWSIEDPEHIVCTYCGATFPDEDYPEDHFMEGKNALGETVRFPYYYNEEKDVRHFLSGHLDKYRREWLVNQAQDLGRAYQATGEEKYARRVVLILDKVAHLYPHWPAIHNRYIEGIRRIRFCDSQEPPYPWDAGRWGWFHNEISRGLVQAYDLIYDSDVFDQISQKRGYDVRERIEDDFFRATYEAVKAVPSHVGNVVGYDVASAAMLGRVLGDPAMVHRAFGWIQDNVNAGFFFDGCWHESASYHYMTLGGLRRAFSVIEGYSDPEGYVDEIDGTHIENLDPIEHVPFWAKVQDAFKVVAFPDGTSVPVHDTWPHRKRSEPSVETVSTIAPGYGQAALGRGRAGNQMQAQLHFSGSYGHAHRDTLSAILWAKGREMLSDIGYTWTTIRWWATSTISHNLVAIDRQEQKGQPSDGDLKWFFPAVPVPHSDQSVSVVAVDGTRAYSNIEDVTMYRRLLGLMPVSKENAYVVDVFRTRGGSMHDWLMHGSADEDMTMEASVHLSADRGDFAGEEPPRSYEISREVQHARANEGASVTLRYAEEPDCGVRLHLAAAEPTDLYLSEVPSVRRVGQGTQGKDSKVLDYWMPQIAARRTGQAPLHSAFAAVQEPFSGQPFIDEVRHVDVTPADPDCVALQVVAGEVVDTIISTLDEEPYPERTAAGVTLKGRLGIVRREGETITGMWLFEGRQLTSGQHSLSADQSLYTGSLQDATRKAEGAEYDAFITSAELPGKTALQGQWIIVTHGNGFTHGYEIDRVEKVGGKTHVILTHEHGLKINGNTTEEVYFPQRTIEGDNSFTIPICATMTAQGQE
ncbi:MAG: heparinase II/III family protein [Armatimonadota bacterium]